MDPIVESKNPEKKDMRIGESQKAKKRELWEELRQRGKNREI